MAFPNIDLTQYTTVRLDQVQDMRRGTMRARRFAAPPQTAAGLRLAFMFNEYNRVRNCGKVWKEYLDEEKSETYWKQTRCKSRYCPRCARIFGKQLLEKLTAAEADNPAQYTSLITLTYGPTVTGAELPGRCADLQAAWKRFRKALPGLRGGIYSYESTISKGKYHLHMHVYTQLNDAGWLNWDRQYLKIVKPTSQAFTPAWLHVMALWERAIEKSNPAAWRKLRPTGIDEQMEGAPTWEPWQITQARRCKARRSDLLLPRRFVSTDIGGRTPCLPGDAPEYAAVNGKWIQLEDQQAPARRREIIAKYVIRFNADEVSTKLAPVMRLFKGKRRIQPYGALFGKVPAQEKRTDEEVLNGVATGRHAVCSARPDSVVIDSPGEHWAAFWVLDEKPARDLYIYRPESPLEGYN